MDSHEASPKHSAVPGNSGEKQSNSQNRTFEKIRIAKKKEERNIRKVRGYRGIPEKIIFKKSGTTKQKRGYGGIPKEHVIQKKDIVMKIVLLKIMMNLTLQI